MEDKINQIVEIFNHFKNHKYTKPVITEIDNAHVNNHGVIFSGVGKNWYLAEKVVKTWISLGINCQSLDPTHALHGDIGMINNQPIFLISKSGNTEELVMLAKYLKEIKNKGIITSTLISINLNSNNKIKEFTDIDLSLDTTKIKPVELDKNNLIPTISITSMQLYLDYLGIEVFEKHPEMAKRYPFNHPAGTIGKTLEEGRK